MGLADVLCKRSRCSESGGGCRGSAGGGAGGRVSVGCGNSGVGHGLGEAGVGEGANGSIDSIILVMAPVVGPVVLVLLTETVHLVYQQ